MRWLLKLKGRTFFRVDLSGRTVWVTYLVIVFRVPIDYQYIVCFFYVASDYGNMFSRMQSVLRCAGSSLPMVAATTRCREPATYACFAGRRVMSWDARHVANFTPY